jgi:hypothetical protein
MSTAMTVIMDATSEALPGAIERSGQGKVTAIGGIPEGTTEGLAAVVVVITLDDGSTVVGQTTLALLASAARALAARYPDPRP